MTDPVEAPLDMKVKPSADGGPTVVEVAGDLVATTGGYGVAPDVAIVRSTPHAS